MFVSEFGLHCRLCSLALSWTIATLSCMAHLLRQNCNAFKTHWRELLPAPGNMIMSLSGGSRISVWEGHWQGARGTKVSQRDPGAEPRWGSGGKAPRSLCLIEKNQGFFNGIFRNAHLFPPPSPPSPSPSPPPALPHSPPPPPRRKASPQNSARVSGGAM
jgi:hypothetical protein